MLSMTGSFRMDDGVPARPYPGPSGPAMLNWSPACTRLPCAAAQLGRRRRIGVEGCARIRP